MKIVSAPVAGAAYVKGHKGPYLVHAVELRHGTLFRVLCAPRVNIESILDDACLWDKQPVTCKRCLKKMEKQT